MGYCGDGRDKLKPQQKLVSLDILTPAKEMRLAIKPELRIVSNKVLLSKCLSA